MPFLFPVGCRSAAAYLSIPDINDKINLDISIEGSLYEEENICLTIWEKILLNWASA